MNWPHETDFNALCAFYGNPIIGARENPKWAANNVVHVKPVYPMRYSWGPPVEELRFHKKVAQLFLEGFREVQKLYGTQADIEAHRLHLTGGDLMVRLMRGSNHLWSVHSWGAAIDLDPQHNPFPAKWRPGFLPKEAAACFEKQGLVWRGANGDVDCMHIQGAEHEFRE